MIRYFRRHPSFGVLSEYVEIGEASSDWAGVRAHLRDCVRCRDEVAWLHRLDSEAANLGPIEPPAGALEKILARRAAGERVILPAHLPHDPPPRSKGWGSSFHLTPVLAGIVVLLFAGIAVVTVSSDATAGSADLVFDPRHPEPGRVVSVRYVPTLELANRDSLRLRVQFRAAGQDWYGEGTAGSRAEVTLYPLRGAYQGRLSVPSVAVYGQLAVEDFEATTVDSRNGRYWELLTYRDGHPSYEALRQRWHASSSEDWQRREETARRMTDLYPDRPEGWMFRLAVDDAFGASANDSRSRAFYRTRFDELQRNLAGSDLGPEDAHNMVQLAHAVGDSAAIPYWTSVLRSRAPRHPALARRLLLDAGRRGIPLTDLLEPLEAFWQAGALRAPDQTLNAFRIALMEGRSDLADVWARRTLSLDANAALQVGMELAIRPATRRLSLEYLRTALETLDTERPRPIDLTAAQFRHETRSARNRLKARIAEVLFAEGAREELRAWLQPDSVAEFDLGAVRALPLAQAALAAGDTAVATELLVQARADLLVSDADATAIAALEARIDIDRASLQRRVTDERARRSRERIEASVHRRLGPDVVAFTTEGEAVEIASLAADAPLLLAIPVLFGGEATARTAERLDRLHERVRARGFEFAVIARPRRQDDGAASIQLPPASYPVLYDREGVIPVFFEVWSIFEYAVLDADGDLRGVFRSEDEAVRLLVALQGRPLVA